MSYGLPGKPSYSYTRPLDYFDFQISGLARSSNPVGNVLLRGLLLGKSYEAGDNYRGIWGLYGSYDYISPIIFRVSTTALSLGTTGQYWAAPEVALQGTVLGGVGFGAAGVTPTADGQRDYHYGVTPHTAASQANTKVTPASASCTPSWEPPISARCSGETSSSVRRAASRRG